MGSKDGSKTTSKGVLIGVALFALPFAGFGVLVMGFAAKMVLGWNEARGWVETPAQIVDARLKASRGDNTVTHKLEARYRYEFDGVAFESTRVGLIDMSDNIGSFHERHYGEVREHLASGKPFRCFVDPEDPEQAILFREMRWGFLGFLTLMGSVFSLVGFGLLYGLVRGKEHVEKIDAKRSADPDRPWLWREAWAQGRIPTETGGQLKMALVFTLFWNLLSAPMWFVLPDEISSGNKAAWVGWLFPAIGIGMLFWCARLLLRWRVFGSTVLELESSPGVLGGLLVGKIHGGRGPRPEQGVRLTLSCIKTERERDRNRTTVLWQDVQQVEMGRIGSGPEGWVVPVRIGIPHGCAPDSAPDDGVRWTLKAEAPRAGVDFRADFHVPVFTTAESDPEFERSTVTPDARSEEPLRDEVAPGIRVAPGVDGAERFEFAAARHKGTALALTLFTLAWTGIVVVLWQSGAPRLFPIVFGLFDLLLILAVLDLWLESHSVDVYPDRLVLRSGLLGKGRIREIPNGEITEIAPVRGMQSGQTLFYRLEVRVREGKPRIAAARIGSLALAERLRDAIGRHLKDRRKTSAA